MTTIRTADAREAVFEDPALEILIDRFTDYGSPEPELRLVSLGISTLELVEVFEDKLVKRHLARATRFVESGLARRTDGFHGVVDCIGRAAT